MNKQEKQNPLTWFLVAEVGFLGSTKRAVNNMLLCALSTNLAQSQSFSYPTRTRFLLEATVNRLEEMGPTNMVFVGGAYFCKLACDRGF